MNQLSTSAFLNLVSQGDPLADSVVADFAKAAAEEKAMLNHGLLNGVRSIPQAPESFRLFLADAERTVGLFSDDVLERGAEPYLLIGPAWMSISLGPGALVHTYLDPGIAKVLVRTKNLLGKLTARRLLETQLWTIQVARPGGLRVGSTGYVSTLQVRLMHARVRASLRHSGEFDPKTPIAQRELVRTWLDFTLISFRSLERAGFVFSPEAMAGVYRIWQLIGQLLGIDRDIIRSVIDPESATALLTIVDGLSDLPDENSRFLVHAMLDVIGMRLADIFQIPPDVARLLADSFCTLFHGAETASKLGVEANWTASLIPLFVASNQFLLLQCELSADYKAQIKSKTVESFSSVEKMLLNPAEFEKTIDILSSNKVPTVKV